MDGADRHALELIDEASSDLGSRFFIRIREELGLAYFVGSSQMVGLARGLFTFYVGTDPRKVELVRAAFAEEIASLAANGLTEMELTRAKKKLLGKQAIAYQSNASLAYTAALDELYGLGFLHYQEMASTLEKITPRRSARGGPPIFPGPPGGHGHRTSRNTRMPPAELTRSRTATSVLSATSNRRLFTLWLKCKIPPTRARARRVSSSL